MMRKMFALWIMMLGVKFMEWASNIAPETIDPIFRKVEESLRRKK